MATKTIQTRIKNRLDTLENWSKSGVTLLPGEIALVSVTTRQTDTKTGNVVDVPAVLIKVGESDGNGGSKAFSDLPWLSAKAADVYDWAKKSTIEEVPVTITVDNTNTPGTLGGWLKTVNDRASTNAADISSLNAKVDVSKVSDAISTAVDALKTGLTHTGTQGSNQIVKAVTQENGKVTVSYGTITEAELPNISASKIKVDNTDLAAKLTAIDAQLAEHGSKVTNDAINSLIDAKINALDGGIDSGSAATNKYVSKVIQTNGKVATTYTDFPTASASRAGIIKLGVTGGAVSYDAIYGTAGINEQVNYNTTEIANLKTSVAGGVHFRGTVNTEPTDATTTVGTYTITAGDVVIYDGKEYICIEVTEGKPVWEQLGDVTRLGNLETKLNDLDVTTTNAVAQTHKFVSQVTQSDGKVSVVYTQPSASDISYGTNSDVETKLAAIDAEIAGKANEAHEHPYAPSTHSHGNITNSGTITTTALTTTTGVGGVVVTDSNNKVTRMSPATVRSLIGAGTSSLTLGTTATTAAKGNHNHSEYETALADINSKFIRFETTDNVTKLYAGSTGTDMIIFDCGGAADF